MEKKGRSGCRIAAFILAGVVLVFALIVAGIFWMFSQKRSAAAAEHAQAVAEVRESLLPPENPRLEFDASDLESLEPLEQGEPVSLRHFLLMMEDPRATELARQTFIERANGAPATWRMTVDSVGPGDGVIGANLIAPYAFRIQGGMSGSSLIVRAEFDEDQRDALISLRQGDRVTISGTLDLSVENQVKITNAQVVTPE